MILVLALLGREWLRVELDLSCPGQSPAPEAELSEDTVVDRHSGMFEFGYRSPLTPRPVPSEIEARR